MAVRCGNAVHDETLSAQHHHDSVDQVRDCFRAGPVASLEEDAYATYENAMAERSCSICDGLGHGYPGGGPCPLEVNEVQAHEEDLEARMLAALF